MAPSGAAEGSAAWLDGVRIDERKRIHGERLTSAQADVLAREAELQERHRATHAPTLVDAGRDNTGMPIYRSTWPKLPSSPEAERIRVERGGLQDAAMDRWVTAVVRRLRYAVRHNEPLLEFLPAGPRRWWLKAVYGSGRPASPVRSWVHFIVCVCLPLLLGGVGAVRWSALTGLLITLAGVSLASLLLAKFNLAFLAFVGFLVELSYLLGAAVDVRSAWAVAVLPSVAVIAGGYEGFPTRPRQPLPKLLPGWARTVGTVLSVASALVIPLAIGVELYRADIPSPGSTIVSYICVSPLILLGIFIAYSLARCAWVGLVLLVRRAVLAPREAISGTLPDQLVVGQVSTFPLVHEFNDLYESVYEPAT